MKTATLLSLLTLTLLNAQELEQEIRYIGNDGTKETHEVICLNGNSGIVTINNSTKEMTINATNTNLGKVTFGEAAKLICN